MRVLLALSVLVVALVLVALRWEHEPALLHLRHPAKTSLVAGAALIPHGDFAYDPSLVDSSQGAHEESRSEAEALHRGAIANGGVLASLDVDLALVITPHGVTSERDAGFYTSESAAGFVDIGLDLHNSSFETYRDSVEVPLDVELSRKVAKDLRGKKVTELRVWCETEPFPLRWGEVIPLLLTREGGFRPKTYIILSLPLRRGVPVSSMVPEMRRLGRAIRRSLDRERFAVIVSGDLAHAHLADGPYGASATADPFEAAVGTWLRNISNTDALLKDAKNLVDTALSCGFLGLVLLLGTLEEDKSSFTNATPVVGPFHPTYYGMATASYLPTHSPRKNNNK